MVTFQGDLLRLEVEGGGRKIVPWQVEMPSGKPVGRILFETEEELKRKEERLGMDIVTALDGRLGVLSGRPPPSVDQVLLVVPTQESEKRLQRAQNRLEESHRKMLVVEF
jgi:hypothetical protein